MQEERTIRISGEVNWEMVDMVRSALNHHLTVNKEPIRLIINSHGGLTAALESILALLRECSTTFHGYVEEEAMSAAFDILQMCEKRVARSDSRLLFHMTRIDACTASTLTGWPVEEDHLIDDCEIFEEMVERLAKRSGKDKDWLIEYSRTDTILTAAEALELGFIDEVVDV